MGDWEDDYGGDEERQDAPEHPPQLPAPWERDGYLPADAEGAPRPRHDAFTPARRAAFLKHLARTGCILDACRAIGVSSNTVYRLQGEDAEFRRHCELALQIARTPVELAAWERGVVGIEEEYVRGGQVYTRVKRSDSILRLLLQGSDRKKYGPRPGFTRKRMMKWERKQIERDLRRQMTANELPIEQVRDDVLRRLEAIRRHAEPGKLAAGWTKTEEGHWIPPGWVRAGDAGGGAAPQVVAADEPSKKGDSV